MDNILNFGLLSREILDNLQWTYSLNDEKRLDNRLDCISLSMSMVNKELLDSFIARGKIKECVIIVIDATMLYREDNERIYCQTNAATKRANKGSEFKDLVAMFDDEVSYRRSYDEKHLKRSEQNLNDNKPTAPQAEILWKDWVNPNYIKGICFYNNKSYASITNAGGITNYDYNRKIIHNNARSEAQLKANESFNDTEFNETYKDDIYQDVRVKQNERANRIRNSEIEIEDKDGNKTKINAPLQNSNQRTIAELEKQEKDVSKQIKEKQDELVREQARQKPNEKSDAVKQLEQEIDELIKKKEDVQNLKKEYETFEEVNQSLLASRTANALYSEVGDKLLEDGKTKKEFDEVVSKISKAETAEQRKEAVDEFIDIIKITDNMKKEIAKEIAKNKNNTNLIKNKGLPQ